MYLNNIYYPCGLSARSVDSRINSYLYGEKDFEQRQGLNVYDFLARTYAPDECRFWQPDSEVTTHHDISPYTYCGGDPVNRFDPDGRNWEIEVYERDRSTYVNMKITGVVYNASSTNVDLKALRDAISLQLENAYSFTTDGLNVIMMTDIRIAESSDQIFLSDHIFAVVNDDQLRENVPARCSAIPGNVIRMKTKLAQQVISGENERTIPHEIGHSGGLYHPYSILNTLPIDDTNLNLMTQISHLQKGYDKNTFMLQKNQIESIVDNYKNNKLNPAEKLKIRYMLRESSFIQFLNNLFK